MVRLARKRLYKQRQTAVRHLLSQTPSSRKRASSTIKANALSHTSLQITSTSKHEALYRPELEHLGRSRQRPLARDFHADRLAIPTSRSKERQQEIVRYCLQEMG